MIKTIKRKTIKSLRHLAYISLRAGPLRHLHLTQSKTITHVSLSQNKTTQCSHPPSRTTQPLPGPEPSRHLHLTQSKTITHISLSQSKTFHGTTPRCLPLMGGGEREHCLPLLRSPRRSPTGSRGGGRRREGRSGSEKVLADVGNAQPLSPSLSLMGALGSPGVVRGAGAGDISLGTNTGMPSLSQVLTAYIVGLFCVYTRSLLTLVRECRRCSRC
jgi:hypothetical protein